MAEEYDFWTSILAEKYDFGCNFDCHSSKNASHFLKLLHKLKKASHFLKLIHKLKNASHFLKLIE